jgi:hypothetical protein
MSSRALRLAAALLVVVLMLLGLAVLPADAGPARPATVAAQVPNPADYLFQHLFANPFKSSVRKTISEALNQATIAFSTPDVSADPRTHSIWLTLLVVADSALLLLLVVGAVMVVAGDWTYLEAKELAPRALIAAMSVNLSLALLGWGIGISNQLVSGFLQVDPNSLTITTDRVLKGTAIAPIVLALMMVGALALLIAGIIRIVAIILLGIGGPLMAVFGVLPQTDQISRAWWRMATACLVAPAVQALLLTIAVKVFFGGGPSITGQATSPGLTDMVMLVVVVALEAYIPLWMLKVAFGVNHRHLRGAVRVGGAFAGVRIGF